MLIAAFHRNKLQRDHRCSVSTFSSGSLAVADLAYGPDRAQKLPSFQAPAMTPLIGDLMGIGPGACPSLGRRPYPKPDSSGAISAA